MYDEFVVNYCDILKRIIADGAVKYGNFTLKSGATSKFYIDCKKVIMTAHAMHAVGGSIVQATAGLRITAIGGPESAGIPIACAAVAAFQDAGRSNVNGFFVRKAVKDHGTKQMIEGVELTPEDSVLLVEDVATSGESLLAAVAEVKATGASVVLALALVDRLQGAAANFAAAAVPFKSILTINDVLK